ncbi:MAG: sigma-70 family RNA polymerase sigma factor [Planctomycetes bacterium]|nr:sigma-70 family RNA polymerase sigma factor [Planctomycetota bacterium]
MSELDDEISTSTTLLRRVAAEPTDDAAWDSFVDRYGRMIFRWCRRWNLQDADAEDLTQGVLLQLARQMRGFRYDPDGRFRAWLRTVAYRAWTRFLETRKKPGAGTGDSGVWRLLESAPARDEFVRRIEEEADRELLERAAVRVRARVMPHTWEAFRLLAVEGLSGKETAERLGMAVGAAIVARSKVSRMIREELDKLTPAGGTE